MVGSRELLMSILFLDPLVLATYAGIGILAWWIWVGRFRSWFGRDATWTALVWPLPLVTAAVPILAGSVSGLLNRFGIGGEGGGAVVGAAYLAAFVLPWTLLCVFPPRWLLPRWARGRLVRPPRRAPAPVEGAVPAVNAWRGPGHGSRARWVCRVDAVPGFVWVDGSELRFRSVPDWSPDTTVAHERDELDDDEVRELEFAIGDEFRLEPPRGGWWTRRSLDVQLGALESWSVSASRPWSDDGLLTLQVEGRRTLRLWVDDARAVERAIATAGEPAGS
jgi:hypothetical protein